MATMAGENQGYWKYRYFFEYCDKIKITVEDDTEKFPYVINILGTNQSPLIKNVDGDNYRQYYIAEIDSCEKDVINNIFSKGDRIYCRHLDGLTTEFEKYCGALVHKNDHKEYKCKFYPTIINPARATNKKIYERYKDLTFNK